MCLDFRNAIEDGALKIELHHHPESLRQSGVHADREIQSADAALFKEPGEGWQGLAKLIADVLLRVVKLLLGAEDFLDFRVVIEK